MKLLTKYYETLGGKVLPLDKFRLYIDLANPISPSDDVDLANIAESDRDGIIAAAEKIFDNPYPLTLASDFIRFWRDGNRSVFEGYYFTRRNMLLTFALAEAIERKNRFTDRVMDGVMLICDEYDWVIPAHIDHRFALNPCFLHKHNNLDLFSAMTGATLALVTTLLRGELDATAHEIRERVIYELHERICAPFMERDLGWMGFAGNAVNNWNPWIVSNVLLVAALTEADSEYRESLTLRAIKMVDNFINGYHTDGGCDEGPSYWGAAGASLFDVLELLYDLTDGYVDIFGEELIRRMGEYEADFNISGSYYINFADCPAHVRPDFRMIARYGRRVGSLRLTAFGTSSLAKYARPGFSGNHWQLYRTLKNLVEPPYETGEYKPARQCWYDGICVAIERETDEYDKGFFVAAKGGHNAESHNHNDVGNFIVYHDGKPVLLDVGVGAYTKKTFSSDRYKIWSMCSDYHNLPTVNGITQRAGKNFHAEDIAYDKAGHSLSLDISKAYPDEAGLVSLCRRVSLDDGVVTVSDDVKLKAEGEVCFTLMCARGVDLSQSGVIKFDGGIELCYSPNLTAELDEGFDVSAEDDSIKNNWKELTISRVLLRSKEFTEDKFEVKLRKV